MSEFPQLLVGAWNSSVVVSCMERETRSCLPSITKRRIGSLRLILQDRFPGVIVPEKAPNECPILLGKDPSPTSEEPSADYSWVLPRIRRWEYESRTTRGSATNLILERGP